MRRKVYRLKHQKPAPKTDYYYYVKIVEANKIWLDAINEARNAGLEVTISGEGTRIFVKRGIGDIV